MGSSHWEAQVRYFEEFLIHGEPQIPIKLSKGYSRNFRIEMEVWGLNRLSKPASASGPIEWGILHLWWKIPEPNGQSQMKFY